MEFSFSITSFLVENFIIYQPELSCFAVSSNGTQSVNDLYIWGKIFKSSIYKTALNLLGYERYSTPMIWNEDLTQLFVIYNLAESYISINQYGYFLPNMFESKTGSFIDLRFYRNFPAMCVQNIFYYGKTYAHSFFLTRSCSSVKKIKNIIQVFFINSAAGIFDLKEQCVFVVWFFPLQYN